MGNEIIEIEDIENKLVKKYSKNWIRIMIGISVLFIVIIIFDIFCDRTQIYTYILGKLHQLNCKADSKFLSFQSGIRACLNDEVTELVVTISTIMAAAVTFFYSIQDNRRGGIPYRSVLVYRNGSWTIPTLFVVTLFLLVMNEIFILFDLYWTLLVSVIICLFINMAIICVILCSTSLRYGIFAITNMEIKQFRLLVNKLEEYKELDIKDREQNKESIGKRSDAYIRQHLIYAAKSDDLDVEKMQLVKELLFVPYRSKEYKYVEEQINKTGEFIKTATHPFLGCMYDYYYTNLLTVFPILNEGERDKFYDVIYKFLKEIPKYGIAEKAYIILTSAIINAVLMSGVDSAEIFCNYVIEECIEGQDVRTKLISLYMLFQEYLNYSKPKNITLKYVKDIKPYCKEWRAEQCIGIMREAWEIWFYNSTLPIEKTIRLLWNVEETVTGRNIRSVPVYYMMLQLGIVGRGDV